MDLREYIHMEFHKLQSKVVEESRFTLSKASDKHTTYQAMAGPACITLSTWTAICENVLAEIHLNGVIKSTNLGKISY